MDRAEIEEVNRFWYEGAAWGKIYRLSDLIESTREGSKIGQKARNALTSWDLHPTIEQATELIKLTVDVLLIEHMPESSSFAELDRGEWRPISAEIACNEVDSLVGASGHANGKACENGMKAAAAFKSFAADANFNFKISIPNADWIHAVASVDAVYCALYFDSDT